MVSVGMGVNVNVGVKDGVSVNEGEVNVSVEDALVVVLVTRSGVDGVHETVIRNIKKSM
jgi:hypothetical protein